MIIISKTKKIKKKKKATKDKIREKALDLFSEKGYNGVSIRDIARAVNIKESSIYSHYKGKDDVMNSIIDLLLEESQNNYNEVPMEDLIDKVDPEMLLTNAIMPMINQLRNPNIRKILRLMCIEVYQNEKIKDFFKNRYMQPTYDLFTQLFERMMKNGQIIEYDTQQLAYEFFNYCLFLLFELFLIKYNENTYESLIDELLSRIQSHIKFIFDMIRKKKADV